VRSRAICPLAARCSSANPRMISSMEKRDWASLVSRSLRSEQRPQQRVTLKQAADMAFCDTNRL
jgi:hypothetical protein